MEQLTKEKVVELLKIKGEARGLVVKSDWDYIFNHYGQEGIEKIEKRMEELGQPFKYAEIENMVFYPIGLDVVSMLVTKEIFGLDDARMVEMGASGPTSSIILRILMKYFLSIDRILNEASKTWQKHYTIGKMTAPLIDKDGGRVDLVLSEFVTHPIHCLVIRGYLGKVLEMIVGYPVTTSEVECPFSGGSVHKFEIRWQPKQDKN